MSLAEQYDAQIRNHREEIRRLGERRNADCCATKKLPSEILSLIFRELMSTYGRPHRPKCVSVTHVCHLWRTIALNEPRLWTDLEGLCSEWLQECVKRSKAAPWNVRYIVYNGAVDNDGDDETWKVGSHFASSNSSKSTWRDSAATPPKARNVLDPLFALPEQLGELHVEGCTDELISRLDAPAPFLSTLTVARVNIPDNFLGGVAPRLHSINLRKSRILLGASWLKNVRRLTLCRWQLQGNSSISAILSALARLSQLEFLSMSFPGTLTAFDTNVNKTVLPNLKTVQFSFSGDQLRLVDIFDHISCPNIRRLSINWPDGFEDVAIAGRVGQFFTRNCNFVPETLRRGFSFDASWLVVTAREDDLEQSDPPRLYFRSCYHLSLEAFFIVAFPGIHIRSLQILAGGGLVLENYPIEELYISDACFRTLLEEPLAYPTLRRLTLAQISLTPKVQTFPKLKRWLRAQRRLERLTIVGSDAFTEKDVQALERIAGDVELVDD